MTFHHGKDTEPDPVVTQIRRLLSGPSRPGQGFTMPGINYDALYRLARNIRAWISASAEDRPVCVATCDRAVMAATLLATLADGPAVILPPDLSVGALRKLQDQTGFSAVIGDADTVFPEGVKAVAVSFLSEEVENLSGTKDPDPDRVWVHLSGEQHNTDDVLLYSRTARQLFTETLELISRYAITSSDRIVSTLKPTHACGFLFSVLLPLVAAARVVGGHADTADTLKSAFHTASPTLLVTLPDHYPLLDAAWPENYRFRTGFSAITPLSSALHLAGSFAKDAGLAEVYTTAGTGSIAARHRKDGETEFTSFSWVKWRVAGGTLEVRSPLISPETAVYPNGWLTMDGKVSAAGDHGFMIAGIKTEEKPPAVCADGAGSNGTGSGEDIAAFTGRIQPMVCRNVVMADLFGEPGSKSLLDRLADHVGRPLTADAAVLRRLCRETNWQPPFTVVIHEIAGIRRVISGACPDSFGVSIHLTGSGITGMLCNLETGDILAEATGVVEDEKDPEVLARKVDAVMHRCANIAGISVDAIDDLVVCGESLAVRLFSGTLMPGRPALPLTLSFPFFRAGDVGLSCDRSTLISIFPCTCESRKRRVDMLMDREKRRHPMEPSAAQPVAPSAVTGDEYLSSPFPDLLR
ncbi:hypothetical protein LJC22_00730 [Desulfosarcina sp. OttesenSCG-928-G10]|nr:hypothetical protein [Desulfosarcina sp. OttesenSCG-928-G10]